MTHPTATATADPWRDLGELVLDERYNGPPGTANGGYACGRIAAFVDGPASVRLLRPVALGVPLLVQRDAGGHVRVTDGAEVVAEARPLDGPTERPDDGVPVAPTWAACLLARERHPGRGVRHLLSDCFVCGPKRRDGLGVTPGPLAATPGLLAAPFAPPPDEANALGELPASLSWAALDCPSYPSALMAEGRIAVLGQLDAVVRRPARVGEHLRVVGWTIDRSGRKHRTGSAMLADDGSVVASGRSTWIELR